MSTRVLGIGLILGGVLVIAVSLLADVIGLGAQPGIIGWKQLVGAGLGVVMLISGAVLLARSRSGADAA